MKRKISTAVIGYGYAGRCFHSYLVSLTDRLKLSGVASRDAQTRQRIETECGCPAYESFEAVLADPEIELIILATPTGVHAKQAIQALKAGKNVVVDKPIATSLKDCQQMFDTAKKKNKLLSVFQNRRWDGDFLTVKKLLAEGRLGELRWCEMAWNGAKPQRNWRAVAEEGGGRLFDLGTHLLDQTLQIFTQPITSVYARMHFDYPQTSVESHCMVMLGFADGATAVIDVSGMNAISKPRFDLFGDKAAFRKFGYDPQEGALQTRNIDDAQESQDKWGTLRDMDGQEIQIPTEKGRWRNYYEIVAAQLLDEKPAVEPVKPQEMLRLMAVLDACHKSAEQGKIIKTELS